MDSTVRGAVGFAFEAHFANRTKAMFEAWYNVLPAIPMWHQVKLRVFSLLWLLATRIRNEKAARSAEHRLCMAGKALIGIVPRSQAVGVGMELGKHRIEFSQSCNGRAIGHIGAVVASGLQLSSAQDAFEKGCEFIVVDGGVGGWVGAD